MAVTSCAKCSYCGKEIALKKDGTFRFHLMPKDGRRRPPECIGTGEKPKEIRS
jgi:hypothetical protein